MKVFLLLLTILIVNVWCKQRCYPISDVTPKPTPNVIISNEACPDPLDYVEKFDVERAKGDWYYIEAYPGFFFQGSSCYRLNNIPTGPYSYNHTYCEKYDGTNSCSKLVVNHIDRDGKGNFETSNGTNGFGYYLDIDYDNYYIVYLCDNLPNGKSERSVYIASRTRTLSDEIRQKAYNAIEAAGFSTDPLEKIEQNEKFCADRPNVIISDKSCPNPPPTLNSFDVEQAAGKWFIVKAYRTVYFAGMSCFTMTFVPTGTYVYNDTFCEKLNGAEKCGLVSLNHINQDGKFDILASTTYLGSSQYLYIDYPTYFISYSCDTLEKGQTQRLIFIGSRTRTLSDALLEEAYGKIQNAGLSLDALETVNQDEEFCAVENPESIISSAACPNPLKRVEKFDVERIKGDWYYVEAYPSIYFKGMSCYRLNNLPSGPSTYNHTYCQKYDGINSCPQAELIHADGDGKFSFVEVGGGFGYYLDIDYDNYYIVYMCNNLDNGKTQRSLWIASRYPTLSDELRQKAYNTIASAGLSLDPLEKIEQNEKFCADAPNLILSDKSCPAPLERFDSFDVQAAAGDWFIVKAYRSIYFEGMDCFFMTFVPTAPYIYDDIYCEKVNGAAKCGVVSLDHVDQDGKFIVAGFERTVQYLYIDYETYFVTYACDSLETGETERHIFIGSRTRVLSDALLAEAYEKIEAAGLSVDALETVNQDEEFCADIKLKSLTFVA